MKKDLKITTDLTKEEAIKLRNQFYKEFKKLRENFRKRMK